MLHVNNTKHTIYVDNQKYKKGFRRKSSIWFGLTTVYGTAWRAWHGIWYGLVDMAWHMVWPGGHNMV